MTEQKTEAYFRFLDELEDKISYGFQHPEYVSLINNLNDHAKINGYGIKSLRSLLLNQTLRNESIEPPKYPDRSFLYLGLEDIESGTGRVEGFREIQGKDVLSKSCVFYSGDIIFARLRPYLNKVHLVQEQNTSMLMIGSSELYVLKTDEEQVLPEFLVRFLLSDLVLTQTKWILTGNSYPRLDENQFLSLQIIVPDKPRQKTIVDEVRAKENEAWSILQKAGSARIDALQTLQNELNLKVSSEGIEDYYFRNGKYTKSSCFVLPFDEGTDRLGFNFHRPKPATTAELQTHCRTITLNEVVDGGIRRGEQPQYTDDGEVLALKTVNLKNGYIDYENCLRVSREFYEKYPKAHVVKLDVLVNSTGYGSMGRVDIYEQDTLAIADSHISIIHLKEGFDPYFITYFLRSPFGEIQFEQWWNGSSGQIELQPTDLGKFLVPDNSEKGVPLHRQQAIANKITQKINQTHQATSIAKTLLIEARDTFKKGIFGN
jgi:restriction endonuclease S subunit